MPQGAKPKSVTKCSRKTIDNASAYQRANREELRGTRYICACGGRYKKADARRHEKTRRHTQYMALYPTYVMEVPVKYKKKNINAVKRVDDEVRKNKSMTRLDILALVACEL